MSRETCFAGFAIDNELTCVMLRDARQGAAQQSRTPYTWSQVGAASLRL
jgi:hypothetical protein